MGAKASKGAYQTLGGLHDGFLGLQGCDVQEL